MFYYIEGLVAHIGPQFAVLDCGGVGYALNTTNNSLSNLRVGEKGRLYVYSHIREDMFDLYGFFSLSEKNSFEMLMGVSGVGPKAALSILSSSTPEALAMAVINGDEKVLTMAPGIGKKIAQRILLELRDKVSKETRGMFALPSAGAMGKAPGASSKLSDAVTALAVLGYGNAEISAALKDIDTETLALEEIVRLALRGMVK